MNLRLSFNQIFVINYFIYEFNYNFFIKFPIELFQMQNEIIQQRENISDDISVLKTRR